MCHLYNENDLYQKKGADNQPLNLKQALFLLKKGALCFLNTLEEIKLFTQNEEFNEKSSCTTNREKKEKLQKI
jgi:hypothetical protein